jgi:DNA polymerase V
MFPYHTDDTSVMLKSIRPKLEQLFIKNRRYRKSGVLFFGLESATTRQLNILDLPEQNEPSQVYKTVDEINTIYGKNSIFTLSEGINKTWQMRRDRLSPNYTTNWNELLEVK